MACPKPICDFVSYLDFSVKVTSNIIILKIKPGMHLELFEVYVFQWQV